MNAEIENTLNIVNLSSHVQSDAEMGVLTKGLSSCPDADIDIFDTIKNIQLFAGKLTLKTGLKKIILDRQHNMPTPTR